jgi:hypothetical protein
MKQILSITILVLGTFLFLLTTNFKLLTDDNQSKSSTFVVPIDSIKFQKSHDIYNDYRPNLIIPPYVYYPPTADNPLLYTNVNISNNTAPQNEPSVKISHKNPNRVVAAWRDFRINYNPAYRRVGYSYSTDGGTTWSASFLIDSTILGPTLLRNSDASVTVDTAGNFYITTIALDNANVSNSLAIYKSTDGGVTFPIGHVLAQGQTEDKEMVTTDLTPGSPYRNNIYISWSRLSASADIHLMRSSNGGTNWSESTVNTSGTYGQGSDPAVGANGEVYVAWVRTNYTTQYFNKSTDGGVTFGTPQTLATGTAPNIPFSQTGPTTFPSIACDISGGSRNGNIYVTWCDGRNGDADVFLRSSTDHGTTWGSIVRVNNDALSNGKCQAWPWIAVNSTGVISIVFYDTRNTPSNSIIEAWLARSYDGGATFSNEVLSSQQSPTNQPNSDVRFGDYIGVDYWANKVVPVWTDERAGGYDMDIYTAAIDLTGIQPAANKTPDRFELNQNYPNPFNPITTINFSLPLLSKINLSVFNLNGQLVSTIYEGEMAAGNHSVTWDGSGVSSGVYFYRLVSGSFTDTKKMILVK